MATPNPEMLGAVEDMARRLLGEEEVEAVMKMCHLVRGPAPPQTETFTLSPWPHTHPSLPLWSAVRG